MGAEWRLGMAGVADQSGLAWEEFSHLSWQGWLAIGILGLLGSGLAYIAWYDALKVISAAAGGGAACTSSRWWRWWWLE